MNNKLHVPVLAIGVIFAISASHASNNQVSAPVIDPVIEFYLARVDSAFETSYIFDRPGGCIFKIKSIYTLTNYRGKVSKSDTAEYELVCKSGIFTLARTIDSASVAENSSLTKLEIERVWAGGYKYYLFPNDTGAGLFSIGFDNPDPKAKERPNGILALDRDSYEIKSLLLNYSKKEGYLGYSESFDFYTKDSILYLKSLEISSSSSGLFGTTYLKRHIEFYDYKLH